MSELGAATSVGEQAGAGTETVLTAGQMMRNAREAAGLHVAALAVSMKIPVKKLEALESDRLDLLHDAVFVRALASSVCRTLKIDPAPVLGKLPGNMAPRLNPDERGINAPFRTPGEGVGTSISALISKPVVWIVLALLVGVVAVAFFPDIKVSEAPVEVTVKAESIAEPVLPVKPVVEEVVVPSAQTTAFTETRVSPENRAASSPVAAAVKSAPASAAMAAVSDAARSVTVVAPVSTGLVVFKARGSSWVKVVDSNGVVQLSKTLSDGETAGASGSTPLSVVVGRVDVTDVEVRGKTFSLVGIAKENVARFEVK